MPSLNPDHRAIAFEIGAEEDVDPRSVSARLDGRRVKGPAGRRIDRALARRGIVPPKGQSPVTTPGLTDTQTGSRRHVDYAQIADPAQPSR
jgi:hypothetical protein